LKDFLIKLYEIFKPFVKNIGIFLAYLAINAGLAIENINKLNQKGSLSATKV